MQFLLRWVITSLAVSVAAWLVPGVVVLGTAWVAALTVGLILTLINMSVKPLFQLLAAPITLLTLGVFYLVVNAVMLELASWLARSIFQQGIVMTDFFSALLAAIIVSLTTLVLNAITGDAAE